MTKFNLIKYSWVPNKRTDQNKRTGGDKIGINKRTG